MPSFNSASNSSDMACLHLWCFRAWETVVGYVSVKVVSLVATKKSNSFLGLKILFKDRVYITWVLSLRRDRGLGVKVGEGASDAHDMIAWTSSIIVGANEEESLPWPSDECEWEVGEKNLYFDY